MTARMIGFAVRMPTMQIDTEPPLRLMWVFLPRLRLCNGGQCFGSDSPDSQHAEDVAAEHIEGYNANCSGTLKRSRSYARRHTSTASTLVFIPECCIFLFFTGPPPLCEFSFQSLHRLMLLRRIRTLLLGAWVRCPYKLPMWRSGTALAYALMWVSVSRLAG